MLIAIIVVAATGARLFILYGVLPLLTALRLSPRVDRPYRIAILWGGLRGAVTLALALAVTENLRIPLDIKREVGILATGFTLFTLLGAGHDAALGHIISRSRQALGAGPGPVQPGHCRRPAECT